MALDDRRQETLTQTFGRVVDDVRELFREEVALARAELRHEVSEFGSALVRMGAGAGAALFALGFVLLGLAQGSAAMVGWPAWGGYLAMGTVLGVAAALALITGRKRAQQVPTLPRTKESIKETKAWMTDRMSSKPR
ncbi:MAG: phage holin family protein [Vicinamibacterales bacterium]